jgi:hypothetical protein
MQGSQSRVARGDPVMALTLKSHQELLDSCNVEIGDCKRLDPMPGVPRQKAQEQQKRIPVASDCVKTHPSQSR